MLFDLFLFGFWFLEFLIGCNMVKFEEDFGIVFVLRRMIGLYLEGLVFNRM